MLQVFGLTYRNPEFLDKSLTSIINTASEPIEISVIHSRCNDGYKNWEMNEKLDYFLYSGKIKRSVDCTGNCKGFGYQWAFREFAKGQDEDFVVLTDLDVVVPEGLDWIAKLRDSMKHAALTAFDLSMENYWNTPNYGHTQDGFGYWLMGVNKNFYAQHLHIPDCSLDSHLINRAHANGHKITKLPDQLYHLGWDLWNTDPEYFADKVKGIDWLRKEDYSYIVHEWRD